MKRSMWIGMFVLGMGCRGWEIPGDPSTEADTGSASSVDTGFGTTGLGGGEATGGATGDPSDDTDHEPPCDTGPDDTGAPLSIVDEASLAEVALCDGATVDFEVMVDLSVTRGVLDMADTENNYWWNEFHSLVTGARDDEGRRALVALDVLTGALVSDWVPGSATAFTCPLHFERPDTMSYVLRVYGPSNEVIDCVAWGHDPGMLVENPYELPNATVSPAELEGCRIVGD